MEYYIYHIPGVKIGCTKDLKRRMRQQDFTEWEILETHTDGWLAGDREIELQKQYGYRVDKTHYMTTVESNFNNIIKPENRNPIWLDREHQVNAGKACKGIPKPGAGYNFHKSKQTCVHCGLETTAANIGRWHNDNCKKKETR